MGTLVCVPPLRLKDPIEPTMNPDHAKVAREYRVQIGDQAWQTVSQTTGARFEVVAGQHPVRIAIGRRTIESFVFTFEAQPSWRLVFKPGYATWSLVAGRC